jgi:signal transduction histidine kinase/ligand-binding sensor domain-containing protein
MRHWYLLLLTTLVTAGGAAPGNVDGYASRVWHTEEGLPEETVQAFAQTPDHFLWIGTSGGLVRFDGAQFVVFDRDNTPDMRENSIFCLLVSRNGTLWIGTEGGGLLSYAHGTFQSWSKPAGLTNGYIRALREDGDGLWIGTDDGLFRLSGAKVERMDGRNGLPFMSIHAIFKDREGRLWFGGYHFAVRTGGRFSEITLPGGLTDNVKSIAQTRDGAIWVGTVGGLWRWAPGNRDYRFERVAYVRNTVRTLLAAQDRTLWIGTIGNGLLRYQNGKFSNMSPALPSDAVLSTYFGSEDSVWVGTQSGLVRLNRASVKTFHVPGFADADFGTVYPDRDGTLWAASSSLFRISGQRMQMAKLPAPLNGVRVRTVFRDRSGALWFGTEGKGVFRMSQGVLRSIADTQPYIRGFAEDHSGGIWIGTDGGYCRWTPRDLRCFEPHESVRVVMVDRDGNIWVGKDRGLTMLRAPGFPREAPISSLQSEKIWAIHQDPTGAMWFGTRGGGLFRWKDGKLTSYTTANGLASNSIYQILEDERGKFWLSGPNGVSSVMRQDLERAARAQSIVLPVKMYNVSDGFETTQMYGGVQPAGGIDSRGEVWFPSTAGPVRIGPEPELPSNAPPAVIYHFVADGREIRISDHLDLEPGYGKLEIQYGAIQLRWQDGLRFRYQLEGFDRGWTDTRARRVAYANIPPGKYRFRLQAFNAAQPEVVSEADVAFRWRPHFYETWWFAILCIAATGVMLWAAHEMRMRQARERFRAVLEERNRLAREMHDTLIQGCTSVSALLEAIDSMNGSQDSGQGQLLHFARLQIRETADEARRAVWNLRQDGASAAALDRLLEQMAQQASHGSSVPVRFQTMGRPPALDPLVEHDIVMVAREAVHNAVRHARPTEVVLRAHFEERLIRVQVEDDGCGFNPRDVLSSSQDHFGLAGMRERIARIGGRFEIRSAPGKGTQVSIHLPFRGRLKG